MTHPVTGAPADVGTGHEARDRSAIRGPSRVREHAAARERIPTFVLDEHEDIAHVVASRIAALIRERAAASRKVVLGLATGSTPIGVYRELIRMHREEGLSFQNVVTFNLDEYYPMAPDSIHSYHRFMWENLFDHVDVLRSNVHIPRGDIPREEVEAWCKQYERDIVAAGGIDFQILGVGKTGHIGFNEPGSGADSRTRLVHLDAVTRRDAAADFFGEEFVPKEAITMGVATILDAREIAILATGEHKSSIVRRAVDEEGGVRVPLKERRRHLEVDLSLDGAAHDRRLVLARREDRDLARLENRGDTHRDRFLRHELLAEEVGRGISARDRIEVHEARPAVRAGAGLVEADVARLADPEDLEIDSTRSLDRELVALRGFLDVLSR